MDRRRGDPRRPPRRGLPRQLEPKTRETRRMATTHEISNGLLLRSDFHKLFDIGLVTVTPTYRIEVGSRIKEEWFNGKSYYRLHGKTLATLPDRDSDKPSAAMLQWHDEHRFRA
ncbi:MAG TPA: HNH endonuclease [Rubrivivax sp.]|nr:HNH endonuclease [Rubrivivax sp.]